MCPHKRIYHCLLSCAASLLCVLQHNYNLDILAGFSLIVYLKIYLLLAFYLLHFVGQGLKTSTVHSGPQVGFLPQESEPLAVCWGSCEAWKVQWTLRTHCSQVSEGTTARGLWGILTVHLLQKVYFQKQHLHVP